MKSDSSASYIMRAFNQKELRTLSTRRFESDLKQGLYDLDNSPFVSRKTRDILVDALSLASKLIPAPDQQLIALIDKLKSTLDYVNRSERSLIAITVKKLFPVISSTTQKLSPNVFFRRVVPDFIRQDVLTVLKDSGASFLAVDDSKCEIRVSSVATKEIFKSELTKQTMPSDVPAEQLWQLIRYTQEDHGIPSPETLIADI